MNYIYDEAGKDVKVRDEKGNEKFFPIAIAENTRLMKDRGYTILKAPMKLDPVIEETEINEEDETNVAEVAPAKRGRKTNPK